MLDFSEEYAMCLHIIVLRITIYESIWSKTIQQYDLVFSGFEKVLNFIQISNIKANYN